MNHHQSGQLDPLAFKWFALVTLVTMLWGLFAAWIAFKYKIPLDLFSVLASELDLTQSLIVGLIYGLVASFILVILGAFGYYNPIIAFVIFLAGIIMFFEFVMGGAQINDAKNLIWLMVLPFVIIRDLVTYLLIRSQQEKARREKRREFDGSKSQENFF